MMNSVMDIKIANDIINQIKDTPTAREINLYFTTNQIKLYLSHDICKDKEGYIVWGDGYPVIDITKKQRAISEDYL